MSGDDERNRGDAACVAQYSDVNVEEKTAIVDKRYGDIM